MEENGTLVPEAVLVDVVADMVIREVLVAEAVIVIIGGRLMIAIFDGSRRMIEGTLRIHTLREIGILMIATIEVAMTGRLRMVVQVEVPEGTMTIESLLMTVPPGAKSCFF